MQISFYSTCLSDFPTKIPLNTARLQLKFQIDLDNHNDTIQKNVNTKQQQVLGKNQQLHKILPFVAH